MDRKNVRVGGEPSCALVVPPLPASIYIYAALRTCGVLDDETINLKEYTQKNSQRASIPI